MGDPRVPPLGLAWRPAHELDARKARCARKAQHLIERIFRQDGRHKSKFHELPSRFVKYAHVVANRSRTTVTRFRCHVKCSAGILADTDLAHRSTPAAHPQQVRRSAPHWRSDPTSPVMHSTSQSSTTITLLGCMIIPCSGSYILSSRYNQIRHKPPQRCRRRAVVPRGRPVPCKDIGQVRNDGRHQDQGQQAGGSAADLDHRPQ